VIREADLGEADGLRMAGVIDRISLGMEAERRVRVVIGEHEHGTTGNWSEATKWSTNPTFPNNGVNTFDVIQNGGTLTVNQAITIEKYNLTGGTNTGAGLTLTLNDLLTWTGGTLDGSGLISADGGANLSGASTKFLNGTRQLNLSGTSTWSGGNITQQSSSTLRNLAGGVFTTSHDGNLAGGFMNNLGTFTKSAGGGTTTVSSVFYNSGGTVNANSGILNFTGGGVHTGTFSAGTGATLQFGGGTHDLNAGCQLDRSRHHLGDGRHRFG
jgi:hypothetical protein